MEEIDYELYQDYILDHFKNPRNFGCIENCSFRHTEENSSCGDNIEISFLIKNEILEDIKFKGVGCAISIAGASILTEKVKGMSLSSIDKFGLNDQLELIRVPLGFLRKKCGLLALKTLKNALNLWRENERIKN